MLISVKRFGLAIAYGISILLHFFRDTPHISYTEISSLISNSNEVESYASSFSYILGLETEERIIANVLENGSRNKRYPIIFSAPLPPPESESYIFMQHMDVIEVHDDRFYFFVHDGWSQFRYNFQVSNLQLETEMTDNLHEKRTSKNSSISQVRRTRPFYYKAINNDFECYRTVESSYNTMSFLKGKYPALVELFDIGPSYLKSVNEGGYELKAMRLSNKNSGVSTKPPMFVICSIHPRELTPAEACARFAEDILEQYGKDADKTWILDYTEIHMVMQGNPDGRRDEEVNLHFRRKNMNPGFCNCVSGVRRGVDMNRNFPHSKWGTTFEGGECYETYPGKSAGSEKETQAIYKYMESVLSPGRNRMDSNGAYKEDSKGVLIDVHSYGQLFYWPYAYTGGLDTPNEVELKAMAVKMASHTTPTYLTDNEDPPISGDTTDYAYDAIGVAPFTLELGTQFHEQCDEFESVTVFNAMNVLLYAARVSFAPYKFPKGPEIVRINFPSGDVLAAPTTLTVTIEASDATRALGYHTGTQNLSAIKVYIDDHPFNSGATPWTQMTSGFKSQGQTVTFNIPLSGLSSGKHDLFIQAYDTEGPGPVYARFFEILNDST